MSKARISRTSWRKPSAKPLETGREFFSDLAAKIAAIAEIVAAAMTPIAWIVSVICH
jgi:hypothetical protein